MVASSKRFSLATGRPIEDHLRVNKHTLASGWILHKQLPPTRGAGLPTVGGSAAHWLAVCNKSSILQDNDEITKGWGKLFLHKHRCMVTLKG